MTLVCQIHNENHEHRCGVTHVAAARRGSSGNLAWRKLCTHHDRTRNAVRVFRSIVLLIALQCLAVIGCGNRSPMSLGEREVFIRGQESICYQLRCHGVECEAEFDWPPYVHVTLGDQWNGDDVLLVLSLMSRLDQIDELSLSGGKSDEVLKNGIASFRGLSVLHVKEAELSEEGLAALRKVPLLMGLELHDVSMSANAWDQLCNLDLVWLSVESDHEVFAGVCPSPGQFTRMLNLRMSGEGVSDATVARIAGLHSLCALTLERTAITDASLSAIGQLSKLVYVNLSSTGVSGESIEQLSGLCRLREVVLDGTSLNAAGVRVLSSLALIEAVSLNDTPITDSEVSQIATMASLRFVSLVGTKTTEDSIRFLSGNSTLLTAVDCHGDVVVFQPRWLDSGRGLQLLRWAASRKCKRFLWNGNSLQPLDPPAAKSKRSGLFDSLAQRANALTAAHNRTQRQRRWLSGSPMPK